MVVDGSKTFFRAFHAHAPSGYDPAKPTAVVLVFHEHFEPWQQMKIRTRLNDVGDAHNVLIVYLEGLDDSWNAGSCCGFPGAIDADDVGFVDQVLSRVEDRYCVDPGRVYALGQSAGGMFALRLACERSERFAAVGSVDGPFAVDVCAPSRAVPAMLVNGGFDPFADNDIGFDATMSLLVSEAGCSDVAPVSVLAEGAASCVEYQTCAPGAAVRYCIIEGGGGYWPGEVASQGDPSHDLDASEAFLTFFEEHPKGL